MRQRQEQERLKNIIGRIDSYEPIVSVVMAGVLRRVKFIVVRKPKMMSCWGSWPPVLTWTSPPPCLAVLWAREDIS